MTFKILTNLADFHHQVPDLMAANWLVMAENATINLTTKPNR